VGRHSRGRARVFFSDSAARQIQAITDERAVHALDRTLTALSVDPALGTPIPDSHPELREYADDVEDVRVIYYVTALRTVIVIAYVEY